jgi:hypothetical protein
LLLINVLIDAHLVCRRRRRRDGYSRQPSAVKPSAVSRQPSPSAVSRQ